MDVFKLSRTWFDFCFENPEKIKPIHTALYFFAIEHSNRLGWKKKFGLPTEMAKEAIGVKSWHVYIIAFNDLIEWQFFELIERSKNQFSSNIIALIENDKANDKALDKAMIKHESKQQQSTYQSTYQSNDSINIQETINKKQETNIPFETFWNLYDKKVGDKIKIEKKWDKLSDNDRKEITEYIPKYINSQPDKKYRKDPATFLNNKSWNDEIIGKSGFKLIPKNIDLWTEEK